MKPETPRNASGTRRAHNTEPAWVRRLLIAAAVSVLAVLVVIPVVNIFYQAFAGGLRAYWDNLAGDPDTLHAIKLTLIVAPVAVVFNVVFGVAAAWALTRFQFPGKTVLTTMIDLPFAVSPVVAGLMFVLLFGARGYLGPWLSEHNIQIIYAIPALILATTFVTLPFVARELIPVMQEIGAEEELAAITLGASGWQMFWRITIPNIKWGLLYGIILCNARAMGEFGAVYVVSGHVAGQTDTVPLRIEKLFQEIGNNSLPKSFSLASLLTFLALVTLAIKTVLERQTARQLREATTADPST